MTDVAAAAAHMPHLLLPLLLAAPAGCHPMSACDCYAQGQHSGQEPQQLLAAAAAAAGGAGGAVAAGALLQPDQAA